MDSHEMARLLQSDAEYLLSRPAFNVGGRPYAGISLYGDKESFIKAVRATVPGKKNLTGEWNVTFQPDGLKLVDISINKSAVCRKVQDVKYDCEPFLSSDDERVMELSEPEQAKTEA